MKPGAVHKALDDLHGVQEVVTSGRPAHRGSGANPAVPGAPW
ncbi:hypothetical protein AB0K67_39650 [Nonomuraea sp. NPDC052634]